MKIHREQSNGFTLYLNFFKSFLAYVLCSCASHTATQQCANEQVWFNEIFDVICTMSSGRRYSKAQ